MDGPYDGAEGIQRPPVGNGSIRSFTATVLDPPDRCNGLTVEASHPTMGTEGHHQMYSPYLSVTGWGHWVMPKQASISRRAL